MRHVKLSIFCLLVLAAIPVQAESKRFTDLRRAVPPDAHMAVWAPRNPERDFQRQYLREISETVEQTDIIDRALRIVTSRMEKRDLDKAEATMDELREATRTIDWKSVVDCQEFVYAQSMDFPQSQHLLIVRLSSTAAADCETAVQNLFALIEAKSDGAASVVHKTLKDVELTILKLPEKVPFSPTIARIDDVLVVSTSDKLARRSAKMLVQGGGKSKFDDPRLRQALTHLPEPEDCLLFLDGKQLFRKFGKLSDFIRQQAQGKEKAQRAAELIDTVIKQVGVLDYLVVVESTDEYRNCTTEFAKLLPKSEDKLLVKMLSQGQPFEDWQRWVPADAISYSLTRGISLHPLHEWLVNELPKQIPESEEAFRRFKKLQAKWELDIDRDILQAFTGETIMVTLPANEQATTGRPQTFVACRCQKPDVIGQLMHRGLERLQEIPQVKSQQLQVQKCSELEGFEELSAALLTAVGVRPVFGFHEGWLIIGSNPNVVKRVLDTHSGEAQSIADTAEFQQFQLEFEGPVSSIQYSNLAEQTRQAAKLLNQVGLVLPMIVGLAGADADNEGVEVAQEIVGLLPSIARIVSKFDFLDKRLVVAQDGEQPLTSIKRKVTLIRPPAEDEGHDEGHHENHHEDAAP